MHPLSGPVRLIIGLCVVIIVLNGFVLWWLQTLPRPPATPVASRQADLTPVRIEPPPTVTPCEPTVVRDEGEIAERDTVIARLKADIQRMKRVHDDDSSTWRTKAEQLEKDLMALQETVEHVIEMDAGDWQEGKILLAQEIVNKKK